jgi:hypothetical protein
MSLTCPGDLRVDLRNLTGGKRDLTPILAG